MGVPHAELVAGPRAHLGAGLLRRDLLRRRAGHLRRVRSESRGGAARRGPDSRHRPHAADPGTGGMHRAPRLRRDCVDQPSRPVPHGPAVLDPRPPHRRPCRLEHRDLVPVRRRASGARQDPPPRHPVRPGRRVRRRLPEAVGAELGRGGDRARCRGRHVHRPGQGPRDRPCRRMVHSGRPAHGRALPAAHAGALSGGELGTRRRVRGQHGRGRVHVGAGQRQGRRPS